MNNTPTGIGQTTGKTLIEQTANKTIRNGQLLIRRDGKTYTITGQIVQ